MPVCPVCQKDNPAGVEYCADCGAALTTATPASAEQASTPAGAPAQTPEPAASSPQTPATSEGAPGTSAPSAAGAQVAAPPETAAQTAPTGSVTGEPAAPPPAEQVPAPAAPTPAAATAATDATAPAPPQTATGQRARLVMKRFGAVSANEFPLLAERLVVGRFDPETGPVDIDLSTMDEAPYISRQHGEIYREANGAWFVKDLGSDNGIFVKGQADASFGPRITAPRALSDGDEIAFGNARFIFRTD